MKNIKNEWKKLNLPYGPVWDKKFIKEKDSLTKRELNKAGTLIDTKYGKFLIGDINKLKGICDDCVAFEYETIVKRYKVISLD